MKRIKLGLVALACLGVFLFLQSRVQPIAQGDPDRYFHLALARETVTAGKLWLSKIPQITGLGWDKHYPDKEFLFHLVNRGLHAVGGDAAVLKIVPVVSGAIVLSVLALLVRLAGPGMAGAITFLGLVLDPYLMVRLGMLRPHLLAILFFVLMLHALMSRSAGWLFVTGMLYSWSYHSFYVPLLVLVVFYAAEQFEGLKLKSPGLRLLLWGALGLLTGLVANPAFPGNLIMGIRHLIIALFEASDQKLDFGLELFPWTTEKFSRIYLPFLVLLMATPFIRQKKDAPFLGIWVSTLGFFALSAQNPRAIEYAVPMGLVLLAMTSKEFAVSRKRTILFFAALGLSAIPRGIQVAAALNGPAPAEKRVPVLLEGLQSLQGPTVAEGAKEQFYNVEWDASPYIYYTQPGFEFVDLLDPSFLKVFDERHHKVRWTLRQGTAPDPWGVVQSLNRKGVKTRYLLARYPGLVDQLRMDPHFKQVLPRPDGKGIQEVPVADDRVFELSPARDPHFVTEFEGALLLNEGTGKEADALTPADLKLGNGRLTSLRFDHEHLGRDELGFDRAPEPSAYLDFEFGAVSRALGVGKTGVSCALIKPAVAERKRQSGKTVLSLGGGRSLRVWLNGKRLFRSIAARDTVDLMERMVKLDRPLTERDELEVLVCSKAEAQTFGVSLGFWTPAEIETLCKARGWKPAEALGQTAGWPRMGEYRETCFGNFIR